MRVLFLTLYPDVAASPRYRVTQFLPLLRAQGIECDVQAPMNAEQFAALTGPASRHSPGWYHCREFPARLRQILAARRYDVVFIQKCVMTAYVRGMLGLLRRRARRLVYDIDDAVHLAPPHPLRFPWRLVEDRGQIRGLMAASDLVLAGNRWLADEAASAGAPNVEYFPTVVDADRFRPAGQDLREPGSFRIGWIGNPSTVVCLEPARAALEQVKDAEICLVGTDPARANLPRAEHRPWAYDSEVAELQRFTIGIMPQPAEPWMRGKCALKALQYMACGIPCVASPFGAVTEFLRHDENGLFAETAQDWLTAFDRLRDPALRARIADAARRTVLDRYSLAPAAARMGKLLKA